MNESSRMLMPSRAVARALLLPSLGLTIVTACSRGEKRDGDSAVGGSAGAVVSEWERTKPAAAPVDDGTNEDGGSDRSVPPSEPASDDDAPSAVRPAPSSAPRARARTSASATRTSSTSTSTKASTVPSSAAPVVSTPVTVPAAPQGPPPPLADSARGRLTVVGSTPFTRIELRPAGGFPVVLTGALESELRPLAGVEIWAGGRRAADGTLEVLRYVVLRVDGVPAIDGTLVADPQGLHIVTTAGSRHRIANPSESLAALAGARVWITGDPATGVAAYGIIRRQD